VMSVNFQDSSKLLPDWADKLIKSNRFSFVSVKKCIKTNRNKTNIAEETNIREVDMNVPDFDMTGKEDTGNEKKTHEITWGDLAKKLDSIFFYVTFILITLVTIVFILILMIGGMINSKKLVDSL
jgi:hypothetical protein